MSFRNTLEQKKIRREARQQKKESFATKHGPFMHISEFNQKIKELKLKQQELLDKIKISHTKEDFISKALNLKEFVESL